MLTCPAEGCKFTTKSDRALTVHLGKCKKAGMTGLASIAEDIERHTIDYRQAKRRRISFPGRLDVVPEAEEPVDANLEVCFANAGPESTECLMVAIVSSG